MPTAPNTSFVMSDTELSFVNEHYNGSKSAAIHAGLTRLMEQNMNIQIGVNMEGFYGEDYEPTEDEAQSLWKDYVTIAADMLAERFPGTDVTITQGVENGLHGTEITFDWPEVADHENIGEYADRQEVISDILTDTWDKIW